MRIMFNTRQKCLLHFLKKTKNCSKIMLAKAFFLIKFEGKLKNTFKFYNFVPYKFGPYSFELFHDIEQFERERIITTNEKNIEYLQGDIDISIDISKILDDYIEKTIKHDESELIKSSKRVCFSARDKSFLKICSLAH